MNNRFVQAVVRICLSFFSSLPFMPLYLSATSFTPVPADYAHAVRTHYGFCAFSLLTYAKHCCGSGVVPGILNSARTEYNVSAKAYCVVFLCCVEGICALSCSHENHSIGVYMF